MKATLLVGAPGSGKSTWGKRYVANNFANGVNVVRLCPDEFRAIYGWGEGDQSVSAKAFEATRAGMRGALSAGQDVLIDACNMYPKARKEFTKIAKEFGATTIAVVFELPKDELLQRNADRGAAGGRNVPADVIQKMLDRYMRPTLDEVDQIDFISKLEDFSEAETVQ